MKSGGWVYILTNKKMGTLYVGSTSDLIGRVWQHKNKAIPGFTSKYNVNKLVYYEWHNRLDDMVKRERQIKDWRRAWKLRLIIDNNPDWRDLYNDILIQSGYSPES
ncbi:MAG: GIY-YIG nuclease family protein [Alphaproteobacteria bacterium]|nr:GIY-YIG nuclease family protein [Alphaproteobacteria bacterium]MBQ7127574.1 GIY-YIG nuclease family protein [Alphaproteobacteria bacterium]